MKTIFFVILVVCTLVINDNVKAQFADDWDDNTLDIWNNNKGNVGIGRRDPNFLLDVNGIVNATEYRLNGDPFINSQWNIIDGTDILNYNDKVLLGAYIPSVYNTNSILNVFGNVSVLGKINFLDNISGYNLRISTGSKNEQNDWGIEESLTTGITPTDLGIGIRIKDNDVNKGFYIRDVISNTERFVVKNGGKVGIGTSNPSTLLHLYGGSPILRLTFSDDADYNWDIKATQSSLNLGTKLDVTNNGIVVNGTIKSVTGGFIFPDGSVQTTANNNSGSQWTNIQGGISYPYNATVNGNLNVSSINASSIIKSGNDNWGFAPYGNTWTGFDLTNGTNKRIIIGVDGDQTRNIFDIERVDTWEHLFELRADGKINLHKGVIQKGGSNITTTDNLGLYSMVNASPVRLVSNNAPINFYTNTSDGIANAPSNAPALHVNQNGTVGIGTTNITDNTITNLKLVVNGSVKAKQVVVTLNGFPDYVFKSGYDLKEIGEVENYIKENGRLPNMPSEKEILEKGANLGDLTNKLVEKVEELTLYIIEQNKKIEKLESVLNEKSDN